MSGLFRKIFLSSRLFEMEWQFSVYSAQSISCNQFTAENLPIVVSGGFFIDKVCTVQLNAPPPPPATFVATDPVSFTTNLRLLRQGLAVKGKTVFLAVNAGLRWLNNVSCLFLSFALITKWSIIVH
jgi:hypothetical protein